MDYTGLLVLLQPSLWWMWLSIAVISYHVSQFVKPIGKTLILRMQDTGGLIQVVGMRWVRRTGKDMSSYRVKKGESHTQELERSELIWTRGNPVLFQYVGSTRPAYVSIEDQKHNDKAGEKAQRNPRSSEFDDFMEEEAYGQGERANKAGKVPMGEKIVWALMGGFAGATVVFIYLTQSHPATVSTIFLAMVH